MKKLNFSNYPTGGWPLILDTLRHWHDGMGEAFAQLLRGFSNYRPFDGQWIRLSGCEFTFTGGGNQLDVTDGYIMYLPLMGMAAPEIHKVNAHTVTKTSGQYFVFQITTANEPVDPIYTVGGVGFSVHETTNVAAVMSVSSFLLTVISDETIPYLWDYLHGKWFGWSPVIGDVTPSGGGSVSTLAAYVSRYRICGETMEILINWEIDITGTVTSLAIETPNSIVATQHHLGLSLINDRMAVIKTFATHSKIYLSPSDGLTNFPTGTITIVAKIEFEI